MTHADMSAAEYVANVRPAKRAKYRNTPATARYLDRSQPGYIGGMLEMMNARLFGYWNDLGVALKTVENHRAHLMEKLQLHDVAALTRYAVRNGFVGLA